MNKSICVYCSSSNLIDNTYFECAKLLGKEIGMRKDKLVYGGAQIGLMGAVADSVQEYAGIVVGVYPKSITKNEIMKPNCDELIIVNNLRERKSIMEEKSDAYIALPGGFGTLEELLEILTSKFLNLNTKPVVILNLNNFFGGLLKQFETTFDEKFAPHKSKELYFVTDNISEAFNYIDNYQVKPFDKWN